MTLQETADVQQTQYPLSFAFVLLTCIKYFDANVPTNFKVSKHMKMCPTWIRIGEYILLIFLSQFSGRMTINVMEMNWQQEAYHGRGFTDMIWKVGWGRSKYKVKTIASKTGSLASMMNMGFASLMCCKQSMFLTETYTIDIAKTLRLPRKGRRR